MEINDKVLISKDKLDQMANNFKNAQGISNNLTLDEMIELASTPKPTGTIDVTENGTYDVTNYASANVDVFNAILELPTELNFMFYNNGYLTPSVLNMLGIDWEKYTINVTSANGMFQGCKVLTIAPSMTTINLTSAISMFRNDNKLTTIPAYDLRNAIDLSNMLDGCAALKSLSIFGMKTSLYLAGCVNLPAEEIVKFGSNCQVITITRGITLGTTLLAKVENIYVKKTGVELYVGITCDPCVICESTDEGAMLFTDYMNEKGWTIA